MKEIEAQSNRVGCVEKNRILLKILLSFLKLIDEKILKKIKNFLVIFFLFIFLIEMFTFNNFYLWNKNTTKIFVLFVKINVFRLELFTKVWKTRF